MPERKGPIYTLLKKLFCKNNGAVTGASNSEVWSVPQAQTSRVSKRLEALGMTVIKLARGLEPYPEAASGSDDAARSRK